MRRKISVIMPVYKVPEIFLRRSIQCVIKQSYKNFELIIIDDGSPDNSGNICEEFKKLDNRIRVFHIKNGGVSVARNFGLKYAEGEYITFIDSDDLIDKDYLINLYNSIIEYDTDCIVCSCKYIKSKNDIIKNKKINFKSKIYNQNSAIEILCHMKHPYQYIEITSVWGKLYKSKIAKQIKFNEEMVLAEDFAYNLEYFQKINKIVFLQYQGYGYRIREDSAINSIYNFRMLKTIRQLKIMIEKYAQKEYSADLIARVINIAFIILIKCSKSGNKTDYKEIMNLIKEYRFNVICNYKARFKVKVACVLSYLKK